MYGAIHQDKMDITEVTLTQAVSQAALKELSVPVTRRFLRTREYCLLLNESVYGIFLLVYLFINGDINLLPVYLSYFNPHYKIYLKPRDKYLYKGTTLVQQITVKE